MEVMDIKAEDDVWEVQKRKVNKDEEEEKEEIDKERNSAKVFTQLKLSLETQIKEMLTKTLTKKINFD